LVACRRSAERDDQDRAIRGAVDRRSAGGSTAGEAEASARDPFCFGRRDIAASSFCGAGGFICAIFGGLLSSGGHCAGGAHDVRCADDITGADDVRVADSA
jgi:hypothetical protein